MWIVTDKGLNYFKDGKLFPFTTKNGLSTNMVYNIFEDSRQNLWVFTEDNVLHRLRWVPIATYSEEHGLSYHLVLSIHQDSEGVIWIGTNGKGVSYVENGIFKSFAPVSDGSIYTALTDSSSYHWFGSWGGGLVRVKGDQKQIFTKAEGLADDVVLALQDGLSHNTVHSLYEDNTGSLWVGTYGGGLNRFKNGKFVVITTEHGLYDNVVHCILEDHLGFFRMSCNRGVYRAAKQ